MFYIYLIYFLCRYDLTVIYHMSLGTEFSTWEHCVSTEKVLDFEALGIFGVKILNP